jgi:hypothetical protein
MKKTSIFLLLLINTLYISAQVKKKKSIYMEVGGAGLAASINYEHEILSIGKLATYARAGLGYFPMIINGSMSVGSINPVIGFSGLFGNEVHHIEVGISNTFTLTFDNTTENNQHNDFSYLLFPSLGYQFQKAGKKKLFYKIGYSPALYFDGVSTHYKSIFYKHFFYFGIGFSF